ncbi:NifB/NifX family molybdenum-iron cluster-binding protein [uncultured Methanobrevibacter sp.]|uniref:NifB/NifX family molybdenum-iron cluster-binding protein n=1 Tax=uncultured Methanobrevibacter sp. TaxID=253161 RepID=UPI0026398B27
MRIAVASSNGEEVDLHFGKASSLYIYEFDEKSEELKFVEQRTVEINEEKKHQNPKIIKTISDCKVAICAQFGFKAQIFAEDAGIKLILGEGTVEESLNKYVDHVKFMNNIKI